MNNKSIPLEECKDGVLYRIKSRNLGIGVFSKKEKGFIGIREKFGNRYLATEYHYDTGAPFGTATPTKELERLPDDIEPIEEFPGTIDLNTSRMVKFDKPVDQGERGWYFIDTGEASEEIRPCAIRNKKLFAWLKDALDRHGGEKHIPVDLCEDYAIYRLNPTHIEYGVFHNNQFVGICGDILLTLVHIDAHGTIQPIEKVGELPKDIPFEEHLPGTIDKATGRLIEQNKRNRQWYYIDNGEACNNRPAQCDIVFNNRLKKYLEKLINKLENE